MAKDNGMNFFGKVKETATHRTAREVKLYRRLMRILPAAAGAMTALVVVGYVVSLMYSKYGSFTVTVNKFDNVKFALTLSEYPDFNSTSARLNASANEEITNISGADLPLDLDNINGDHSGENYVAYTFYVKNCGRETVDVDYEIYIRNMTLNIDRAVRVRLYTGEDGNRSYADYARTRTDGGGPEPNTTEFYNLKTITKGQIEQLRPNEIYKFTVVIWLEGDDPDCIDDVLGGQFKIDMNMNIHGVDENGETIPGVYGEALDTSDRDEDALESLPTPETSAPDTAA